MALSLTAHIKGYTVKLELDLPIEKCSVTYRGATGSLVSLLSTKLLIGGFEGKHVVEPTNIKAIRRWAASQGYAPVVDARVPAAAEARLVLGARVDD
jgi:hypothetical protein